jgi:hypothetical protein
VSPNELNKMKPNSLIPYKNRQLRRVTNTAPPPAAFEYGLTQKWRGTAAEHFGCVGV